MVIPSSFAEKEITCVTATFMPLSSLVLPSLPYQPSTIIVLAPRTADKVICQTKIKASLVVLEIGVLSLFCSQFLTGPQRHLLRTIPRIPPSCVRLAIISWASLLKTWPLVTSHLSESLFIVMLSVSLFCKWKGTRMTQVPHLDLEGRFTQGPLPQSLPPSRRDRKGAIHDSQVQEGNYRLVQVHVLFLCFNV